jgi:hypothetical protein
MRARDVGVSRVTGEVPLAGQTELCEMMTKLPDRLPATRK